MHIRNRLRTAFSTASTTASLATTAPFGTAQVTERFTSERLDLSLRPLVAEDHRDFGDAELARRFQPKVAIDDFRRRREPDTGS